MQKLILALATLAALSAPAFADGFDHQPRSAPALSSGQKIMEFESGTGNLGFNHSMREEMRTGRGMVVEADGIPTNRGFDHGNRS